jgi:dTDP-4-amino-4,6-dideoxygalactose transaminase
LLEIPHAIACSSGTAAIHAAIAAINPDPGDEIITSPITDMGAITPILYQGAIPVFADVDPTTCNITAETIEQVLSPKTKAIIVTHLFGNPCEMDAIISLAKSNNLPIIEDCAQAYLAAVNDRPVGTLGTLGCFSLQQGKHITCGEGGLVVTRDPSLARRVRLFVNKAWGYGDPQPDHYFLALNYRMTELQGAVAVAQLTKLRDGVAYRIRMAERLTARLAGLPGVKTPHVHGDHRHVYWRYTLRIDPDIIPGGAVALGKFLSTFGIASAPRYIQKPAFQCEIFRKQATFGNSRWPFTLARPEAVRYDPENYSGVFKALSEILVLPWNERYTDEHVDYLADRIWEALTTLRV